MWKFITDILLDKDEDLTIFVLEDSDPDVPETFRFNPKKFLFLIGILFISGVLLLGIFLKFTPLGSIIYHSESDEMRRQVIQVRDRLNALEDSLLLRDQQFENIKKVISSGSDTSFTTLMQDISNMVSYDETPLSDAINEPSPIFRLISSSDIIESKDVIEGPDFPSIRPMVGTLTRGYKPNVHHYGIDIAGQEGTTFKSVADGIVMLNEWTLNFGYVITVLHRNGFISIYKHASDVFKESGQTVKKGQILGRIGNQGILNSGPHLHFEIWKEGKSINPVNILEQL